MEMTITQKYLLCAVGEHGSASALSTEKLACLLAACLAELHCAGCLTVSGRCAGITGELTESRGHLAPVYRHIRRRGPLRLDRLLLDYSCSPADRRLNELFCALGDSLAGAVRPGRSRLLHRPRYVPEPEAAAAVADSLLGGPSGGAPLSCGDALLALLLDIGGAADGLLDADAQARLRRRLAEALSAPDGAETKAAAEWLRAVLRGMTAPVGAAC